MALAYPEAVIGSHTGGTYPYLPPELPSDLSEAEQRFVADARVWIATEMAYYQLQATKPQTIAAALTDSPAGLAAWLGEKFWRWTDNEGRIEDAISMDGFLTNLTVYWVTGTIGPSMRSYYESARAEAAWGTPPVPVGYLMPVHDMFPTPREWIERQGPVSHWTEAQAGGHFLEWEEPELVAGDLRAFFGPLADE
jgi:pimeloyl-ACP methyl ester carboxylesterase